MLTVDPARRLAQSMGLTSLDNTPRLVPGVGAAATTAQEGNGADSAGSLHAMMLDMKRTFDEIVEAHADPDRATQILANPFYQSLSSSFAGTQEYMAMEKLGQLRRADEWDLIVVDTPPSRSALDFLDAPQRLSRFLDGRLLRLLTAPAKVGGRAYLRVLNAGFGVVTGVLTKILGTAMLKDVQTFVSALDTMFGGFRERADYTYQLLRAPGTSFLVVAAPEEDALREASYFVDRLDQEGMPLAGTSPEPGPASTSRAPVGGPEPGRRRSASGRSAPRTPPRLLACCGAPAARGPDGGGCGTATDCQAVHGCPPADTGGEIPAQAEDVHDLDGLRQIGHAFGAGGSRRRRA